MRVAAITALAMVAFAANSVLTRAALDGGDDAASPAASADPAAFSLVRISAGAVTLLAVLALRRGASGVGVTGAITWRAWPSALALFGYVAGFSYAYLSLGAGTGALILFGVVQASILSVALLRGERLSALAWTGLALALAGLAYLVAPGVTAPDAWGATLMAGAGIAWAVYTLRGRTAVDAAAATTANFALAVPLVLLLALIAAGAGTLRMEPTGFLLAVASGAIASALGYLLWYSVLPSLSRTVAGIVQLTPAPLAAAGGLLLIGEPLTARLLVATVLILGGVALAVAGRNR